MAHNVAEDPPNFKPRNVFDRLFGFANPNPARAGCPPAEVLTALAEKRLPIRHPAYEHLLECSPCYRAGRVLLWARPRRRRRQQPGNAP